MANRDEISSGHVPARALYIALVGALTTACCSDRDLASASDQDDTGVADSASESAASTDTSDNGGADPGDTGTDSNTTDPGDPDAGGSEEGGTGDDGGVEQLPSCVAPLDSECELAVEVPPDKEIAAIAATDLELVLAWPSGLDMFGNTVEDGSVIAIDLDTFETRTLATIDAVDELQATVDNAYVIARHVNTAKGAILQVPLTGGATQVVSNAAVEPWQNFGFSSHAGKIGWVETKHAMLANESDLSVVDSFGDDVVGLVVTDEGAYYRSGGWIRYDALNPTAQKMFTSVSRLVFHGGQLVAHRQVSGVMRLSRSPLDVTDWFNFANCDVDSANANNLHVAGNWILLQAQHQGVSWVWGLEDGGSATECTPIAALGNKPQWAANSDGIFSLDGDTIRFTPYP